MNSSQLNPVVLVHGLTDTNAIFKPMTTYLQKHGWVVHSLDLIPSNGDYELDRLAQQLETYIELTLPNQQPFDLIGFSMGGIVSRYYVQRLGGLDRVQRFITISSPHNGTLTAHLSQRPGCIQMRPNSSFLNDLNRDVLMLEKLNFTSIWTPMDLMIVPATSSQLQVGRDIQVNVPLHAWMVQDPRGLQTVANALREPV
ncbi:lipase [Phormidesmis priestleyi ULC007]|uniref:Lipase n=1 Tax=Phormidesmis priestleyi ULC007 TaxID=1920490 RepID=A0A2T1DEN4_9CYAN|nr:triacylglycerol lipase [Phormidesmis priestleyi]PSB18972.1 lipase [Phormidesmis priestleyi ULC007]PZO53960.1 MAG: lipase [Phormidesmis priestleyi]